jgi:hypothetical protein
MKVAVVKSTRYNDLWATHKTNDPFEVYKTTLMRCSQIGLSDFFDTDYIIVKESFEYPCQEIIYGWEQKNRHSLRYNKKGKHLDLPFLDDTYHNHITLEEVSHEVDAIDWEKYNIVITLNACVPERITKKYPTILWCYYVSENDDDKTDRLLNGYRLLLNQDVCKPMRDHEIGFPYSFCGTHTIRSIGKRLGVHERKGFFIELNNSTERPFLHPQKEFLQIEKETQQPILLHHQNILENCKRLCRAKYYVKLFGRKIRGNGITEAISAGCLLLMNKSLVMYSDLIMDECHVETTEDVIRKINEFEKDKDLYNRILVKQRHYFTKYYVETPILSLMNSYRKLL